ncbi:hypothetical protein NCC78_09625, partial [Micromonospora phytophila]|uniref:hypothetical protein n=1 Tax=Micromonospora phytophila TaxID=709888 RepID=UPI00202EFCE3
PADPPAERDAARVEGPSAPPAAERRVALVGLRKALPGTTGRRSAGTPVPAGRHRRSAAQSDRTG